MQNCVCKCLCVLLRGEKSQEPLSSGAAFGEEDRGLRQKENITECYTACMLSTKNTKKQKHKFLSAE